MTNRLQTSLISLVCGATISAGAFAAPTVRSVGGTGTYTSAASATSARSGSLRSTSTTGGLRPSVSTTATGSTDSASTATGSVSNGGASMARTASSPRLSIGKYIGAPKSISTSPTGESDLTARVEKLESDVIGLESNKQDNMSGSDYIEIDEDNKILLNLELLKTALETELESKAGTDGREVIIGNEENGGVDDTGIYWWYAGDTDNKQLLLSWDQLRSKLNLDAKLDKKYDLTANPTAGGMALVVDKETGEIKPTGKFVNAEWSGDDSKNKVLVTDENGNVVLSTNEMVNPDDLGDLAYLDETDLDLGDLAWEDDVSTGFIRDGAVTTDKIADGAVTRAKMADEIAEIMDWIKWWKQNVPGPDDSEGVVPKDADGNVERPGVGDGTQYVLSMDKYGNARWFRVVTPENAATIEAESETP